MLWRFFSWNDKRMASRLEAVVWERRRRAVGWVSCAGVTPSIDSWEITRGSASGPKRLLMEGKVSAFFCVQNSWFLRFPNFQRRAVTIQKERKVRATLERWMGAWQASWPGRTPHPLTQ